MLWSHQEKTISVIQHTTAPHLRVNNAMISMLRSSNRKITCRKMLQNVGKRINELSEMVKAKGFARNATELGHF